MTIRKRVASAPSLSLIKFKLLFRLFLIDFFSNLLQAENPSVLFFLCFHLLLFNVLDIKPRSQRPLAGDSAFGLRRPSEPCLGHIMQIIGTIPSPGPLMAGLETARGYSSSNTSTLPSSLSSY